jgi:hypothetical protein
MDAIRGVRIPAARKVNGHRIVLRATAIERSRSRSALNLDFLPNERAFDEIREPLCQRVVDSEAVRPVRGAAESYAPCFVKSRII